MDKYMKPFLENYDDPGIALSTVLVAALVIIVTIALFKLLRKKKFVDGTILLTGVSDSGKTALFMKLVHWKCTYSHTSIKENVGTLPLDGKSIRIVDIPGDVRIRQKFFDKYKSSMTGLIYVIDSVASYKNMQNVAEYLHELLIDPCVKKGIPIFVFCNKQDKETAKACSMIQLLLEKEIGTLDYIMFKQILSENTIPIPREVLTKKTCSQLFRKLEFADGYVYDQTLNSPPKLEKLLAWFQKVA